MNPTLDVADDNTNTSVQVLSSDGPKPQPNERSEKDVVMQDATSIPLASPDPPNDNNLPPWLAQMIAYLRGVSDDVAWQDLVTAFVAFEKCGPPHGVSYLSPSLLTDTTHSRRTEITYEVATSRGYRLDQKQEKGGCTVDQTRLLWQGIQGMVDDDAAFLEDGRRLAHP